MTDKPTQPPSVVPCAGVVIAKIAVSAVIIYALFARIDHQQAAAILTGIDGRWLMPAIFALTTQLAVHVFVWQVLVGAVDIVLPGATAARILLLSLFFNQALPASLGGSGARIIFTWRENVPLVNAVSGVVVERVVFLVVLLGLAIVTLPSLLAALDRPEGLAYAIVLSALCGAGVVAVFVASRRSGGRHRWAVVGKIYVLLENLKMALSCPYRVLVALILMLIYHAMSFLAVVLIARSTGSEISIGQLLVFLPHVFLASALPISVNGWGVREITMVGLLAVAGVSNEEALMISLIFGIGVLLTRLPMGLLWLFPKTKKNEPPA